MTELRDEGDRLAVGLFTAVAHSDPMAMRAMLDDARPDVLREACHTLAAILAGVIVGNAVERGRPDPGVALDDAARNFGVLTRAIASWRTGGRRG